VTQAPKNVVASVFASLRNVAQEGGISFNNILQSYVIERFVLWEWTSARFRSHANATSPQCAPSVFVFALGTSGTLLMQCYRC
jgi:hypothetical protein